jgi:hypothetical protein
MQRRQAGDKKRQCRGLLVFSELPSLPSAGSRSDWFRASLGCKPRSLILVSLGWFDYSKKLRKDNPTPAYSPVSDRRRLTALVEVHWDRRVSSQIKLLISNNSFWIVQRATAQSFVGIQEVEDCRLELMAFGRHGLSIEEDDDCNMCRRAQLKGV